MTQPFQFSNGQLAHSAEDLLELCQQFPDDGVNYLVREDLEKWLSYIGKEEIAQCAANARQTPLGDRQKLEEFLNKCHSLSSPESRDLTEQTTEPETVVAETPVVEEVKPEPETVVAETPVVEETKPELETVVAKTPVVEEVKPEPETVVAKTPVVETKSIEQEQKSKSSTSQTKPSFFQTIAKLVVNVLYRNKE